MKPPDDGLRTELATLTAALAAHVERRRWFGARRTAAGPPAPSAEAGRAPGSTPPAAPDPVSAAPGSAPGTAGAPAPRAGDGTAPDPVSANVARAAECRTLESLREAVAACTACPLCETRRQTVFADGTERARVLFIGEAPGEHEDRQGVPFVGRAGQLLTDIVTKGMGLERADVYIANVLKCRPPGNRDPEAAEKARCTPFLDRQIELVDPEVILTLGLHASQHVLGRKESMGRLRGHVHLRGGRKVVATYHPAFLLRSPHMKKECWQDVQLAMRELGLAAPAGRPGPREPGRAPGNRPDAGR